jgi:hypothetical protein
MQIPSRERVDKLTTILKDPANKFDLRLKQVGLEYRSVAHIVARAESYVELLYRFQNKKKEARNSLKNAKSRISRQISQVEKTTGKNFSELPDDIKMSSFLYETLPLKKGIVFHWFYGFLFHNTFITVTS